jgi:hypothetical protein
MHDSHALAALGVRATSLFEGFPYLVTRVVPAMYHVTVLPDDLGEDDLLDVTRRQARANALPTSLVRGADSALLVAPDGREHLAEPPRGGVIVADRLRPCRPFAETRTLVDRRLALARHIAAVTPRAGYMLGDLPKGGRPATFQETVLLAGRQRNGVPRGLTPCARCGRWRGRCLDPSPELARLVVEVHCRCGNDNRCAACRDLLHETRLNGNVYNEADGQVWHTPGFAGFGHACTAEPPAIEVA